MPEMCLNPYPGVALDAVFRQKALIATTQTVHTIKQYVDQAVNQPGDITIRTFDPVQTTKKSGDGAINMLGLAKRVKARIMQASTSEVYGRLSTRNRNLTEVTSIPLGVVLASMKASAVPRRCFLIITASRSKIIHKPLPSDDRKQREPDITSAKQELDWKPKIKLEGGLVKTIGFFRDC